MVNDSLARTPLYALHLELGARLVEFAGYEMPVQYPAGVLREHQHTRTQAGLFDVSHMGQIQVRGSGAAAALESVVCADIASLPIGRQRYALLTNEQGGILDDLMVAHLPAGFLLVVNAATKYDDFQWLRSRMNADIEITMAADRSLVALQGPAARDVLSRFSATIGEQIFMDVGTHRIAGTDCVVSCSGYTGEDGFELSMPAADAERLTRLLLAEPEVAPVGLGARDSLRLEAGLCLYGQDIDSTTTPIEAGLRWAIGPARRPGGARAGGYPGAAVLETQMQHGHGRRRVLLKPAGRAPVRGGTELTTVEGTPCGRVTSGGFGPSVGGPVAMGYVDCDTLAVSAPLLAHVRGKAIPVEVVPGPLVAPRYVRRAG